MTLLVEHRIHMGFFEGSLQLSQYLIEEIEAGGFKTLPGAGTGIRCQQKGNGVAKAHAGYKSQQDFSVSAV